MGLSETQRKHCQLKTAIQNIIARQSGCRLYISVLENEFEPCVDLSPQGNIKTPPRSTGR